MRHTHLLFLFLFSTIFFFSCKEDEDGVLILSNNQLEFLSQGSSQVLNIETGHDWYIESAIDWISFVPTSGTGNSAITVVANANEEDIDRNSTFYIKAGHLTRSVRVSQKGTYLTTDVPSLLFDREGTPQEINITTRFDWTIDTSNAQWCEIEPMEGSGNCLLTLTPLPITERYPRHNARIKIGCNGETYTIIISQDVENTPPTQPILVYPQNKIELEGTFPYFVWEESIDEDEDEIFYQIYITEDRSSDDWEKLHSEPISETSYYLNYTIATDKKLKENTVYYWKVVAMDNYWGGETESEVFRFTTGTNTIHADGTVEQLAEGKNETAPILVILGDGFIENDYGYGGLFDVMANVAVESFFSVEPFPTYRDYFTVYKIVAYSEESGATVNNDFYDYNVKKQTVNTKFESSFVGGDSPTIDCNTKAVFYYVQEALNIDEETLNNTTILLIINLDVYAGTTLFAQEGRSIAMCPTGRDTFWEVVQHEGAGHGFGRLLDEYITHQELTVSDKTVAWIESGREYENRGAWWFGANVSLTDSPAEVHWRRYIDREGYQVSFYEGACEYGKGIWCPEEYSCMKDNLPYFNAPSREAMVRRIKYIAGEEFSWEEFYANEPDIKYYPTLIEPASFTKSVQKRGYHWHPLYGFVEFPFKKRKIRSVVVHLIPVET